jgi:prepilin-type N-terminal cleavage/methylation domain-containing protein
MRPASAALLNPHARAPTDLPMARRVLNRLRRDERGFTLPEVLVVSAGLAVILAAILGLADVASKLAPQERERVHAMRDAEVALAKMTRELREAHAISVTSWKATATLLKDGATITVVYDCSGAVDADGLRKCDRTQTGGSGAGTQQAIARVANPSSRPVFSATNRNDGSGQPWTTYVKARLEVPSRGERSVGGKSKVVFEDGVYLRNVDALH